MSLVRITATFDFECDAGDNESEILEGIRQDIRDVIDCWETSDIKVLVEDEYCIQKNDKKTN
jgi:hypothetical protein